MISTIANKRADNIEPNLEQGLGTSEYKQVMRVVEQAILATDLALYFRRKDQFLETANTGEIDWQDQDKKDRKSQELESSIGQIRYRPKIPKTTS